MTGSRFEELVSRYLDAELDGAEARELYALLAVAEQAQTFVELTTIDREIAGFIATPISDDKMIALVEADLASLRPHAKRRSTAKRSWAYAAVAAVLLLALGAWSLWPTGPSGRGSTVRLQELEGDAFVIRNGDATAAQVGQRIQASDGLMLRSFESSAVVVYEDGTKLEFVGEVRVASFFDNRKSTDAKRVQLVRGDVFADVAPQPIGRPMMLVTPRAEVAVLGTRFQLSGTDSETHLETEEGKVRVTRTSDRQSIVVDGGYDIVVGDDFGPLRPVAFERFDQPRCSITGFAAACVSPDGRTLALRRRNRRDVALRDLASGRQTHSLVGHTRGVQGVAFSADARLIATGSADRSTKVWAVADGSLQQTLDFASEVSDLTFIQGTQRLAVLTDDRRIMFCNLADGITDRSIPLPAGDAIAFSSNRSRLAVLDSKRRNVTVIDLTQREPAALVPLDEKVDALRCLAFSPDGEMLAVGGIGRIVLCSWREPGKSRTLKCSPSPVYCLAFAPDGQRLALGQRLAVTIRDLATGAKLAVYSGHATAVNTIAFTNDGAAMVVGSGRQEESVVNVWDLQRPNPQPMQE